MHSTLLGNGDSHCRRIVPPGGTLSQTATIPFLDDNEEVKCCWVSRGSSWYLEAASNVATRVGLIQSKYFENLINLSFPCTTVPPSALQVETSDAARLKCLVRFGFFAGLWQSVVINIVKCAHQQQQCLCPNVLLEYAGISRTTLSRRRDHADGIQNTVNRKANKHGNLPQDQTWWVLLSFHVLSVQQHG